MLGASLALLVLLLAAWLLFKLVLGFVAGVATLRGGGRRGGRGLGDPSALRAGPWNT